MFFFPLAYFVSIYYVLHQKYSSYSSLQYISFPKEKNVSPLLGLETGVEKSISSFWEMHFHFLAKRHWAQPRSSHVHIPLPPRPPSKWNLWLLQLFCVMRNEIQRVNRLALEVLMAGFSYWSQANTPLSIFVQTFCKTSCWLYFHVYCPDMRAVSALSSHLSAREQTSVFHHEVELLLCATTRLFRFMPPLMLYEPFVFIYFSNPGWWCIQFRTSPNQQ